MTPQQTIGIAIRLFAIFLWVTSFGYLSSLPTWFSSTLPDTASVIRASVVTGITYLLVGLALWFFPMVCAHKILPRTHFDNTLPELPAREYARVGCALIGLWLLAKASAAIIWFIFRAYLLSDGGSVFSTAAMENKADLLVSLFELVLAISLIVKCSAFARLIVPSSPEK